MKSHPNSSTSILLNSGEKTDIGIRNAIVYLKSNKIFLINYLPMSLILPKKNGISN